MENLPLELLEPIINALVHLHLPHSRKLSLTLRELLDTRRVCRSFDKAVLKALHARITFPNISFYRCRFNPSQAATTTINTTRNSLLTSALYRSCQSYQSRLLGNVACKRILNCLKIAQAIVDDYSKPRRLELLKLLCEAAAKSPYNTVMLVPTWNTKVTDQDVYCIQAMLSTPAQLECEARDKWWDTNPVASMFGNPIAYAAMYGRTEVLKVMLGHEDGEETPNRPIEGSVVEAAIEGGQVASLQCLFELDPSLKSRLREEWNTYVLGAIRVGNVDVLQFLLETAKTRGSDAENLRAYILLRRFALVHAARFGRVELVRYLLSAGAKVNRRGITPLAIARDLGFVNVEAVLLGHGAKLQGQKKTGVAESRAGNDKEKEGLQCAEATVPVPRKKALGKRVMKRLSSFKRWHHGT